MDGCGLTVTLALAEAVHRPVLVTVTVYVVVTDEAVPDRTGVTDMVVLLELTG
jgi:hypothetical protein